MNHRRVEHRRRDRRTALTAMWAAALVLLALSAAGCTRLSEKVEDPAAGLNGGFEQAREGLPANWLVYSPSTIPTGRYELAFDAADFKEGRQSLRFDVEACSADGGWRSPGIAQEVPVAAGETYRVHFWIKSDRADYVVIAGGVTAKTGSPVTVDDTRGGTGGWREVERSVTLKPAESRLRFELSIRSPGTVWIDDVRIEPDRPV